MSKIQSGILLALIIAIIVVAVDVLFFRHHTAQRLMVNIGIVLVVGAFYLRFFKK
jgi:cell division protein FtsL